VETKKNILLTHSYFFRKKNKHHKTDRSCLTTFFLLKGEGQGCQIHILEIRRFFLENQEKNQKLFPKESGNH
jgi:hypothetical protein